MHSLVKLVLVLLIGVAMAGQSKAEQLMISAVAPWTADGEAFRIAKDKILFQGEFRGIMYFSGGEGVLDARSFSCPARQVIEMESGKSAASGYCMFEARDDAFVFADWICEGVVGACEGSMTIRDGTGHLEGIGGQGKILIRSALSFVEADFESGLVVKSAEGIAIWPALEIRLPSSK